MVAPFFWIPVGFVAGLAAAWAVGRPGPERAVGQPEPPAGPIAPETLALRLRRLNAALEPATQSLAHARELDDLPEFKEMVAALADPAQELGHVLEYAFGNTWVLGCAALAALKERPDGRADAAARVADRFDGMSAWQIQYALALLAVADPRPPAGAPLAGYANWWADNTSLPHIFADYLGSFDIINATLEIGHSVRRLPPATQGQIKTFLGRVHHPAADLIADQLADAPPPGTPPADPGFLAALGRFWGDDGEPEPLIAPEGWADVLDDAAAIIDRKPVRSLLVSGEPLVGKSTFLKLLAGRHEEAGWRVFEASAADLMAGQKYIGELEGRIRQALEELSVTKKVIWYIPDLLSFALSGTHQGQSASILDQILPAITAGRLLVWAEATPASAARLLQLRPKLRRLLEVVRLEPMDEKETTPLAEGLAKRLAKDRGIGIEPSLAATAIDAAQDYLNAASLPGSALALVKLTVLRTEKTAGKRLAGHDVLETLAQMTGLPISILDGQERIELEKIRAFFGARVIGQSEAIESVVDRIAMLKSGLNDPGKPIAVFLFAGPTGTGKTELAKTLSAYLFGSEERMVRLDMSEYQSPDSVVKLIGGPGLPPDADTLIARIRKQPFSLVLLDEFEKSSPVVWDLFLQVFDEGRLTDTNGQTADFRHCLIILTTNLGATVHQSAGLGFAPVQSSFTGDQVLRTIGQTFRPEFQNRLDKIIVFKPLTRELMRGILKKELDRLFERRGLKDRAWAVEWEASALEFLLEKGFTPEMGARPLKRAIDQYVVAPLAAAIVERRFPEGDQFVFVKSDGTAIQAEFVDPDGDGEPVLAGAPLAAQAPPAVPPTLGAMMLGPRGDGAEVELLSRLHDEIAARLTSPEWNQLKSELAAGINAPEFWTEPKRFQVLTRLELMDRLEVAADTAASLQSRLARRRNGVAHGSRELVARLALQIHLVREGLLDVDADAPVEAIVVVEPALEGNAGDRAIAAGWAREIREMYRAWAKKRNMQTAEIDRLKGFEHPAQVIGGFGAHRLLAREAGLHVLEQVEATSGASRIAVRVLVATLPPGDPSKANRRVAVGELLARTARQSTVVRRYRRQPAPLVRNADGSWRSGKLDAVLRGDFDVLAHEPAGRE